MECREPMEMHEGAADTDTDLTAYYTFILILI